AIGVATRLRANAEVEVGDIDAAGRIARGAERQVNDGRSHGVIEDDVWNQQVRVFNRQVDYGRAHVLHAGAVAAADAREVNRGDANRILEADHRVRTNAPIRL